MATEKSHSDILLDLSEEELLKELEPREYHSYSAVEESVCGWARAAPLSCILLTQTKSRRPQNEAADSPNPSCIDPVLPHAESSAVTVEHRSESRVRRHKAIKKSMPLKHQVESLSDAAAVAALQLGASESHVAGIAQASASFTKLEEEERTSLQPHRPSSKCSDHKLAKPQKNSRKQNYTVKNSHKPRNTLVPVTNLTFFPPIKPPQLNPRARGHLWSGRKALEGEMTEESCFMLDKRSDTRGGRLDSVADVEFPVYSITRTCQHNPVLFSAVSVSVPKQSCCTRRVK